MGSTRWTPGVPARRSGLLARRLQRRPGLRVRLDRVGPAQLPRGLAHPDHPGRDPGDDRVGGDIPGHHRVGADDRVVADAAAAQDAGAVADPDVGADRDIALVDALPADRPLDFDHAVVEVDEHRPVGDYALLADSHPLVGGDRALLAHDGLRADLDQTLVAADLGLVADPDEAAELDPALAADLQFQPAPEEEHPGGAPAAPGPRQGAAPEVSPQQLPVAVVEHPVARDESCKADHGGGDSRLAQRWPTPPRPPRSPNGSLPGTSAPWPGRSR